MSVIPRDLVGFPSGEREAAKQEIGKQGGEDQETGIATAIRGLESEPDRHVPDAHRATTS